MLSTGELLERCRLDRLTRNQHLLFRLGELIAYAETAAIIIIVVATVMLIDMLSARIRAQLV